MVTNSDTLVFNQAEVCDAGMTVEEAYELVCNDIKAIYGIKDVV
jgi:hypothetical protein